ncbi:MAG: HU family DNA-binding protein [Pseudomonadota bacterium]
MTKSELAEILGLKMQTTKKMAEDVVNHIFDDMCKALSLGRRIEIRGFGAFSIREYKSYTGRNPKTGDRVEVEPKKLPFFKVGKDLKERVDSFQE